MYKGKRSNSRFMGIKVGVFENRRSLKTLWPVESNRRQTDKPTRYDTLQAMVSNGAFNG
jgi:hypothetical protein